MGRKINPYDFRLGVIYDWKSRWYAKKGNQYSEQLAEDFELRKYIRSKVSQAGVSKIDIERFPNQVIVTIFTAKPGIIIGRKGAAVKELREAIERQTGKKVKLEISEIENIFAGCSTAPATMRNLRGRSANSNPRSSESAPPPLRVSCDSCAANSRP